MNNRKWLIIGIVSVAVIGTIGYLYYRKKKKKTNLSSTTDKTESNTTEGTIPKIEKTSQVDNSSQAVKITEKKLSQLRDVLSNYEFKNNSVYDKKTGGKISENASWSVWGLLNRNYNNLLNGVKNDKSINNDTREYALKVMEQYKALLEQVFPANIYNKSSQLYFKYKLGKIKETDIYNERV
jgi:hypothetical protein